MGSNIVNDILLRSMVEFLLLGSVAGVLMGAILLWRPDWLVRTGKFTNLWVSSRHMSRPLDKSIEVEHWVYRFSRPFGIVLLAGALYIDYIFTSDFNRTGVLAALLSAHIAQPLWLETMLDALVLIFLAGAQLALIASLFLLFRPSMLRDIEQKANQRISVRKALKPMEMQHSNVDQYVFKNVLLVGMLLLLGSMYTFVMLVIWLSKY